MIPAARVSVPVSGREPAETDAAARILDALAVCIARHGVGKTTVDDVATEAGCSRATLYRHHRSKSAMLEALVAREWRRLTTELAALVDGADSLDAALVAVLRHSSESLRANAALSRVLELEPELVLPYLTFDGLDATFTAVSDALEAPLQAFVSGPHARRVAEWLTRIVLSYTVEPGDTPALTDPDSVRRLVCDYVVPGLAKS
ncbi:MAG: TetR/AcrR family transcriptional regulator [Acidimicrobiia bacterium]